MGRASGTAAGLLLLAAAGCATFRAPSPATGGPAAVAALQGPLPGRMAALYRLRVPRTGGLRLAVVGTPSHGRLTVSRPMGGSVLAAQWWEAEVRVLDLERGCEAGPGSLAAMTGLGVVPVGAALELLAGRLPGEVLGWDGSGVTVGEPGWTARAVLGGPPWRVVRLEGEGWVIELDRHTASVPGAVRVEREDGGWFELELIRLEWDGGAALPALPELPPCRPGEGR